MFRTHSPPNKEIFQDILTPDTCMIFMKLMNSLEDSLPFNIKFHAYTEYTNNTFFEICSF